VDEKPTSVAIVENPNNPSGYYPIAIRFVKVNEADKIELKNIITTDNVIDLDNTKGYAIDISQLLKINVFTEKIGTNYKVSGIVGNVVSMTITEEQFEVSELAKGKLEMQFSIGVSEINLTIP
jgi:hypothetical protein